MNRSSEQHRYEWACYRLIASETGVTAYSVYEFFASRFLREISPSGDIVFRKPTSLEDWEHSIYIQQIHHFVACLFPQKESINGKPFTWPELSERDYEYKLIKK